VALKQVVMIALIEMFDFRQAFMEESQSLAEFMHWPREDACFHDRYMWGLTGLKP
jgi:hypothetical protein